MSSSSFNTPPWFLDLVRRMAGGQIGLDPCSNPTSLVNAKHTYTIETNRLDHPWFSHGMCFMNPPHSMSPNNIEPWMEKAYEDFITISVHADSRDQFIALVPAKTSPLWFHNHAVAFDKCFLKGRIKFWENGVETEGPGKFDSLVLYRGVKRALFRAVFQPYGWCP